MKNKLIKLYLQVCDFYNSRPLLKYQRLSNFKPTFTDEELLTIYLFGHLQGLTTKRRIYDYISEHWLCWFPKLPSYQAFNRRLNLLVCVFESLIESLLNEKVKALAGESDKLIDSVPVMLAKGSRSNKAKVAKDLADTGYCATKATFYRGVKLHMIAIRRVKKLPLPFVLHLSKASRHDLCVLKELNPSLGSCFIFADKAYSDLETKKEMKEKGAILLTPYKRKRNESETEEPALWSRFVSSIRQPLESLFNFLIQRTDLQNASKVRSSNGLLVHCYGKLAVACLLLTSYY